MPERARRAEPGGAAYDARAQLGLSEADLAAHAGLDADQVEAIETGGLEPTWELIERLARAMNAAVRVDPSGDDHPIRFEVRTA
jgi:ribosome-binding protein aMBF1 (putative translation factor)